MREVRIAPCNPMDGSTSSLINKLSFENAVGPVPGAVSGFCVADYELFYEADMHKRHVSIQVSNTLI